MNKNSSWLSSVYFIQYIYLSVCIAIKTYKNTYSCKLLPEAIDIKLLVSQIREPNDRLITIIDDAQ